MISVIIPVYNTGSYLKDCINSISGQSYTDLQILIIDDGSEKETADLCDQLAADDDRIEVIHKKNEGVSVARNLGLQKAKGDIICFVDSDDTIRPQMMESFAKVFDSESVEIVICDAVTKRFGKEDVLDTFRCFRKSTTFNPKEIAPSDLTEIAGSAWRCAYKFDLIKRSGAHFPVGLKFSEDRLFNLMAMGDASNIRYIKQPYYNRLIRPGSACFRFYPDLTSQIVLWRNKLLEVLREYWGDKYYEAYEDQVAGHIKYAITNYTSSSNNLPIRDQIKNLKELCNNKQIIDCLKKAKAKDSRSIMIIRNHYLLLYIIGKVTNKIHKLCRKGQYQQ